MAKIRKGRDCTAPKENKKRAIVNPIIDKHCVEKDYHLDCGCKDCQKIRSCVAANRRTMIDANILVSCVLEEALSGKANDFIDILDQKEYVGCITPEILAEVWERLSRELHLEQNIGEKERLIASIGRFVDKCRHLAIIRTDYERVLDLAGRIKEQEVRMQEKDRMHVANAILHNIPFYTSDKKIKEDEISVCNAAEKYEKGLKSKVNIMLFQDVNINKL